MALFAGLTTETDPGCKPGFLFGLYKRLTESLSPRRNARLLWADRGTHEHTKIMNEAKLGPRNLAVKLAKILAEIGKVPKSGHNAFHKYDYVTENDLVYAVRDKLSAAGIFVFTSTEKQEVQIIKEEDKTWALTTVTTRHTFVDAESGEEFSVLSQGQGADNGDKGGYKATTGAMKYFLYKCFMIPTGDDPEADEKTDQRAAQPRRESASSQHNAGKLAGEPPATAAKSIEVKRDVNTQLRDKFLDGRWEQVEIHFGKNRGEKLGRLETRSLDWYAQEWQPKPFKGNISEDDEIMRAALDAYLFEK